MLNNVKLHFGDVVWLKTPQTLAPLDRAKELSNKIRPFIVINPAEIPVDHNNISLQDRSVFGLSCTSQDFLVEGRPHIKFMIKGQQKPSYAMFDGIRDINTQGQQIVCKDWLSDDLLEKLSDGLDKIIRAEQRFYLRKLFNSKKQIMPGQVRRIKTIDCDGPAVILLKRGKFVVNDDVECSDDFNKLSHQTRFTPYLAMYLHNTEWTGTFRNVLPLNIRIISVHERDIHEQVGITQDKNVENLINQIRRNAGLKKINYRKMDLSHHFSLTPFMRLIAR